MEFYEGDSPAAPTIRLFRLAPKFQRLLHTRIIRARAPGKAKGGAGHYTHLNAAFDRSSTHALFSFDSIASPVLVLARWTWAASLPGLPRLRADQRRRALSRRLCARPSLPAQPTSKPLCARQAGTAVTATAPFRALAGHFLPKLVRPAPRFFASACARLMNFGVTTPRAEHPC